MKKLKFGRVLTFRELSIMKAKLKRGMVMILLESKALPTQAKMSAINDLIKTAVDDKICLDDRNDSFLSNCFCEFKEPEDVYDP